MTDARFRAVVIAIGLVATLGMSSTADAQDSFVAQLRGGEEVPAISTGAVGFFLGTLSVDQAALNYTLIYFNVEGGTVAAAHIHFAQAGANGGITAFLCGGGGKPDCPAPGAAATGTVTAADVQTVAAQGIAAGDFAELVRAMRAGLTYVNVHTGLFPSGEIRGQIR
jgi:hypothetical protein